MLSRKPKGAVEKKRSSGATGLLWMFVGAILTLMIGLFLYLWNPIDMGSEATPEEYTVKPINQGDATTQSNEYEFYELLPEQEITNIPDEAIVEDEPDSDGEVTLKPDVVVTQTEEDKDTDPNNYGISEETILEPIQSQDTQTPSGDQEMVIVEEDGTYDEVNNVNTSGDTDNASSNTATATSTPANSNNVQQSEPRATVQAVSPKKTYILQINSYSTSQEADARRAQVLMAGVDATVVRKKMANNQVFYQVVSNPMVNRQAVLNAQQKLQNNGIDSLIVEQNR